MSDQLPTQTGELGEMPEPTTEPREEAPGGVDAVPEPEEVVPADLDTDLNVAVDDAPEQVQEAVSGSEDTDTQATEGRSDEDAADESTE